MGRKRKTIGILVSGIMDKFTESVCKGVFYTASKADVDLVVFPCKYLDRDLAEKREIMYEYQYNTLFSYAGRENVDGLLVSADSIGCYTSKRRMREVLEKYTGIPCVLVASKLEGYTSVSYDNETGVREAMEYLIGQRHCRKFCMVGGSNENTDAYERKQVFLKLLKENDISFSEENYAEGSLSRYSSKAYGEILDNNPGAEAIFCVNDDTAMGLYDEMKRRGILPGKDIYVFGYDNTVAASKSKPSLSSIQADSAVLGEKALELLLAMLAGEKVESLVLPTKFILRDSCGFRSEESGAFPWFLGRERMDECFDEIFYRLRYKNVGEAERIHSLFLQVLSDAIALVEDGMETVQFQRLLASLDEFLNCRALEYADVDKFVRYCDEIFQAARRRHTGSYQKIGEIFTMIYGRVIHDMDFMLRSVKETEESDKYAIKLFVSQMMQFENGNDSSYAVLLQNLEWLNIQNAYVYVFEKPVLHLQGEEFLLPDDLRLKAAMEDGVVQCIPETKQKINRADIFSHGRMAEKCHSFVCFPMFYNEMLHGMLLCDLTDKIFENGEFVVNQMSSAVRMIELLKDNKKIQLQLEENIHVLHQKNVVLDSLSKSDGLTGILNRRGFFKEGERFLERAQAEGKRIMAAYVDMNNLKVINDRYGHEDGDFSLQLIGKILTAFVGDGGIVGRIGGDEFACIAFYSRQDEGEDFKKRLYEEFQNYNAGSEKHYNITVSAGIHVVGERERENLREALALADLKLYEEKKLRTKNVDK